MESLCPSPSPRSAPQFLRFKSPKPTIRPLLPFRPRQPNFGCGARSLAVHALQRSEHDVVIVGAGIIGLSIAHYVLLHSNLSVAVVDAAIPCSGATGAGQGYIWMVHKTPGSGTWELAMRSKKLWEELADGVEREGLDPREVLGWKKTGSLLVGRTLEEVAMLEERVKVLCQAGLRAEYLSSSALHSVEPALDVGKNGGAAFLPDDCQLDAFRTVSFIEKVNRSFSSGGRYAEFYNDPAIFLSRSEDNGMVEAIQTSKNILYGRKTFVLAAGAWTGSLLQSLAKPNTSVDLPIKPRKGHLLVLENCNMIKLNHGIMEVGYIDHQVATSSDMSLPSEAGEDELDLFSISMTATIDVQGNLVLGSSRQFCGFSRTVDQSVIKRIWNRAGVFFPALKAVSLDQNQNRQIRIGHRPYMPGGKPVIASMPGMPHVILATGHEGSGLSLAWGTAEMVGDMILDCPGKVDCTPFSLQDRFSSVLS